MRSLKEQITLLVMAVFILLTMSLLLVFYFMGESSALMAAETKAKSDLDATEAIIDLKYPGPWSIRGEELLKGQADINNNFVIVDGIENLTGDVCAIFRNNICVSTTVEVGDCNRAIGNYAPYEVTSKILETGYYYTGQAELSGKIYQTAYKPITDEFGQIIGVLYIGVPTTDNTILLSSIKMVGLVGLIIALLIGLITRFLVTRTIVKPLQEVIKGTREVAMSTTSQPLKIQSSNEIGELSQVFTQMLVGMNITTNRLHKVNEVAQRADSDERPPKQEQSGCNGEDESEWFDELLDSQKELPKGLNRGTLKQIALFLKQHEGNKVTTQDVSEAISLSKVTVRHYFEYLDEIGLVDIEQKYGSVGRPLRFFKLKM